MSSTRNLLIQDATAISEAMGVTIRSIRTKIAMRPMCLKKRIGEPELSSSEPRKQKDQIQLASELGETRKCGTKIKEHDRTGQS